METPWSPRLRPLTIGLLIVATAWAFESLAVATILPEAATELGGLNLYGWAFSAFLLAKPNGRISVSGSVGGQGVSAANRSALQSHINQIVMPPLPAGSSWIGKGGFLWPTYASMTVQNEAATAGSWRIGMPCPGTTYTKKDGSTAKIAL